MSLEEILKDKEHYMYALRNRIRNPSDREEVFAEALLCAVKHEAMCKSLFLTILQRRVVDFYREQARHSDTHSAGLVHQEVDPLSLERLVADREQLSEALRKISNAKNSEIILFIIEGGSYQDAAREFGRSTEAIRHLMKRFRRYIRRCSREV